MSEEKMSAETETEEEAVTQAEATAGVAGTSEDSSEELTLLLEDARAKADEHWNQVLRVQADLENTRRRAAELLPVIDSLELGLAAATGDEENIAKLREGTELTLKMFSGVLEKFGMKQINPQGEPFNAELHQAMTMQPSEEYPPNTVTAVMQKGYVLNDRLIRPAMVMVSK